MVHFSKWNSIPKNSPHISSFTENTDSMMKMIKLNISKSQKLERKLMIKRLTFNVTKFSDMYSFYLKSEIDTSIWSTDTPTDRQSWLKFIEMNSASVTRRDETEFAISRILMYLDLLTWIKKQNQK